MKQFVDSFSPIHYTKPRRTLEPQYGVQWLRLPETTQPSINTYAEHPSIQKKSSSTLEGFISMPAQPQPTHVSPKAPTLPYAKIIRPHVVPLALRSAHTTQNANHQQMSELRPYQHLPTAKSDTARKRSVLFRALRIVQFPLIIIAAVIVGLFMQTLVFGEIAIGIYAILALLLRFSSRTTFQLAFITLIGIVLLSVIGKDVTLATNFAVYTFLLLGVGTVLLIREDYQTISV